MSDSLREGLRRCKTCGTVQPLEQFGKTYGGGKNKEARRRVCKKCIGIRRADWGARNLDKIRAYQRRTSQRRRELSIHTAALMKSGRTWNKVVDAYRRTMAENPPELSSEEARLAYFRGYVAGSRRSQEESERFEALKDLVHRIASDFCRKKDGATFGYEDAVAAGYLGALKFLRSDHRHRPPEETRSIAARAIRASMIDDLRSATHRGARSDFGIGDEPGVEHGSTPEAPSDLSGAILVLAADERDKAILQGLSEGKSQEEIAGELGISGAAISRRVLRIRGKHGNEILRLCASSETA